MRSREHALADLLKNSHYADAAYENLTSDASQRTYRRYHRAQGRIQDHKTAILMDYPPKFGSVKQFVTMAKRLAAAGVAVPDILAESVDAGYLLLEDFGDVTLSRALMNDPASEAAYYTRAIAILIHLQQHHATALIADLPRYGDSVQGGFTYYQRELSLFTEWYVPAAMAGSGTPIMPGSDQPHSVLTPSALTHEFVGMIWQKFLRILGNLPPQLVLRDYHVDNLMVLFGQTGIKSLGLLDFQDALSGPAVYDVASLLRDARRDVNPSIVTKCARQYCDAMNYPPEQFARDFALLALQRNFKILGIFVRLAWRDGKFHYLAHIPRLWRMIDADLTQLRLYWQGDDADNLAKFLAQYCPISHRALPLNILSDKAESP